MEKEEGMETLYIVDEESKEVIEQPFDFHRMSIAVHNEDGYTNLLVHGVSIYFTKEEAEEKLKTLKGE
tara:strand:- start:298 stop:501 length:204 start_codon:yes stop_codon:yes gene_type:complete